MIKANVHFMIPASFIIDTDNKQVAEQALMECIPEINNIKLPGHINIKTEYSVVPVEMHVLNLKTLK